MRVCISLAPLMALSLAACGGGGEGPPVVPNPPPPPPPPPPEWFAPDCAVVTGAPVATYSPDVGITLRPNEMPFDFGRSSSTSSIVAVPDAPGTLFAMHGGDFYMSSDAGCSWHTLLEPSGPTRLVATGRWAFGMGGDNDDLLVFDAAGFAGSLAIPFSANYLTVSASEPGTIYAISYEQEIWRSADQGHSWAQVATKPDTFEHFNRMVVDPQDRLHWVVTVNGYPDADGPVGSGELAITFDGGATWVESSGIADPIESPANNVQVLTNIVVNGGSGTGMEIWVEGRRIDRELRADGTTIAHRDERFIARSTDGGLTFVDVVTEDEVPGLATSEITARPGVAGELLFAGRRCPYDEPKLYHYRASDDSLTIITYPEGAAYGFGALEFNPVDPDVLYLGHQTVAQCPP